MIATFRKRRYRISFEYIKQKLSAYGWCDPPDWKNKRIRIEKTLKGQHRLEILIHEALHASHWDICEEAIAETAVDISRMLYRLGYRDLSELNQESK